MQISKIKESARIKLKGKYLKCVFATLIYFIILMILSMILSKINSALGNHTAPLIIIQAIFAIISFILSYGLIDNIISITDEKTKSITKFIDSSFLHATKYIKILLQILIRTLIPILIFLLCYFYLIATFAAYVNDTTFLCFSPNLMPFAIVLIIISLIVLIYFLLKYVLASYIFNTNKEKYSPKEVVEMSKELMKKQKLNYVLLILSFIGWILLAAIICSILSYFIDTTNTTFITSVVLLFYSFLRPYMITSELIFFENLVDVQKEESQ